MYVLFIIFVIFYMFLHSFLAHNRVKKLIYDKWIPERYYRFFFVSYAILFLFPVAILYFKAEKTFYFTPGIFISIVAWILIIFSLYIFYISFKNYNFKEFLGLDRLHNESKVHYQLNTGGINGYVRHPLYSASYTLMAGIFLLSPDQYVLAACIIISVYLPIGIVFEEQKLVEEYSEKYIEYKQNVPMLVPFVK